MQYLSLNLQNGPLLADDRLALYDAGHRFENVPLLLVLLRSLPFTPVQLQLRVLQVESILDGQSSFMCCARLKRSYIHLVTTRILFVMPSSASSCSVYRH